MGLGGFFDYSKPGPGINKNAPEKHTFVVFFETWFRNVWRLLPSGCIYVLLNLFLIPSGLGSAGLTNIARNMARDKHSFGFSDFIDTIKRNWKQSLVAGILNVVVTTLVVISGWLYYFNTKGWMGTIGASLMITAFFVLSVMKYYIWLLIITFKMSLKNILKNAFYFVFIGLKKNLIIGICSILWYAVSVGICLLIPYDIVLVIVLALNLCFFPGFKHLLIQFCIFPVVKKVMIDPYYEEHPDDDVEIRRNLGLVDDEEDVESVFNDKQLIPEDKDR